MALVLKIAIYALEFIFACGIIGSAVVVILTSIEDSKVFFSGDRDDGSPTQDVELTESPAGSSN